MGREEGKQKAGRSVRSSQVQEGSDQIEVSLEGGLGAMDRTEL